MFRLFTIYAQTPPPDPWQVRSWQVAVVAGLLTALLALAQAFLSYLQRRRELRWKQAEWAGIYLDRMFGLNTSYAALMMVGKGEKSLELKKGEKFEVSDDDLKAALTRRETREGAKKEETRTKAHQIRRCFDGLFYYMDRMEQAINIKLIRWEDVSKPTDYYVERLARYKGEILDYLAHTKYDGARSFLSRFPEWEKADEQAVVAREES